MSIERYIDTLTLAPAPSSARTFRFSGSATRGGREELEPLSASSLPEDLSAAIDTNALLSFVDGVSAQERDDVLFSVQFAARGASNGFDRFTQIQSWYQKYIEILENLGWAAEQFAFAPYDQGEGEVRMDKAALAVITAIATQNQLAVLQESIRALEKLAADDGPLRLFDFHTSAQMSGNFQLGAVQRSANGALALALGAFYFRSRDTRRRFLFFSWGAQQVNFWTAAQKLTLNGTLYAPLRERVRDKLGADAIDFIAQVKL